MDINEAIAQVENDLAHTLQELADARDLMNMLEDGRKKLEVELLGLRSFAQRSSDAGDNAATPRPVSAITSHADVVPISDAVMQLAVANNPAVPSASLAAMSRTDAVLAVMAASSGPLDRAAIVEHLFQAGREDTLDSVSLTLSGLKRSKRVERLGKGLWQVVATRSPRPPSEPDRLHSIEN